MSLYETLFGEPEVNGIFSDSVRVQRMLDFEAALARAEARVGVIPKDAAGVIARQCESRDFDLSELAEKARKAGNLVIPLIQQLTAFVERKDRSAARYVHWGATSQDVIDTGLVLQAGDALALIDGRLAAICRRLAVLIEQHRYTPVVARTWMQHAVPTVLGFKFAGWLDVLLRRRARILDLRRTVLVLQFGGAAGTLATLADKGAAVAEALAEELHLSLPDIPWHSHRDRVAELGAVLAILVGSLGKVARDISLLAQTEVGELAEPAEEGRGGSSTMPHKRNPVACSVLRAAAERAPALACTLISAMDQEYERGLGGWQSEWETLPELFRLAGGAVEQARMLVERMEVHADAMARNLEATQGLIFAEPVMMALAPHVGKPEAHRITEAASRAASASHRHLRDVLLAHPEVAPYLNPEQISGLFDPLRYTGSANQFIDRVLDASRGQLKEG